MIQRAYEGAKRCTLFEEVIVATDDQRILDVVLSFGGKAMMTSQSHPSGTDRCAEVASAYSQMDVVVNIQGDEPLVDFRQLEQLIKAFEDRDTQIATLGNKSVSMDDLLNPNRIKIVVNNADEAIYFSRSPIPNFHHAKQEPLSAYPYLRHIGLYAYRSDILSELTALEPTALELTESLEQLRWLYYGYSIKVVETTIETPNIDVPEDVQKVLNLL
jgi:3-deoxy-manno-octulosonate cytidylyltransferase (CMP-KDO synthetase)